MRTKRIQNRISESRWTPSFVFPIAFMLWGIVSYQSLQAIIPMLLVALATFLMVGINNGNALIRIYSRMVSCSFLVLATLDAGNFHSLKAALVLFGGTSFFYCFLKCYQNRNAPGWMFYAFLSIGLISVVWVQVLFFLPVLWYLMATGILAFSFRNFVASVLGVLCPYWLLLPYLGFTGNLSWIPEHFSKCARFEIPFASIPFTMLQAVTLGFILLVSIIGLVHVLRQQRSDSIRTRLLMRSFVVTDVAAIIFLCLQPHHSWALQGIIIVCTSPLIGHFFALTKTKFTNWVFVLLSLFAFLITFANLWKVLLNS